MRWTEEEYEEFKRRQRQSSRFVSGLKASADRTVLAVPAAREERRTSEPRHVPGRMNKTEAAYGQLLELQKRAEQIKDWRFEAVKLRLAEKTFYTPDFMVVRFDDSICFVEVKGFWRDDARVKIKVAAEQYPCFRFVAVRKCSKKQGGGWAEEAFRPSSS